MDHFERRLEIDLAHLLDPIVSAPAPRRRRRHGLHALSGGLCVLELTVVAEPVPAELVVQAGTAS